MRIFAFAIGIICLVQSCAPSEPSYSNPFKKNLSKLLRQNDFQGGYILIKNGSAVLEERRNFNRRISGGNLKHLFLTVGALRLADQGKINIDKPVRDYLPQFPLHSISIKSLMNHTSCLGSDLGYGEYWIWSNENLHWLEVLIATLSGKTLNQFFQDEFFEPLDMENSFFTKSNELKLTIDDLLIWDEAWDSGNILSSGLRSLISQPTVLKDSYAENKFNYGLGVYADGNTFWQSSSQKNFSYIYFKIPNEKITILLISKLYKTKGELMNWKSLITESIYENRKITFQKKYNPKKYIGIQESLKQNNVPAVGIALVRDFKVVWAENYGIKELESNKPVDANTLFRAGSLTKPITALTYLRFAEQNSLNGNERLNSYAKDAKIDLSSWESKHNLTANRILSHMSGLTERENWSTIENQKADRLSELNSGKGPELYSYYSPGKKSRYSGGAYAILQEYMTKKSGAKFPRLVDKFVFQALGMKNSTFVQDPSLKLSNRALGHDREGKLVPVRFYSYPELAAGGMWTTPRDLASFFIALQKSISGHTDALITQAIAKEMMTPLVPAANLSIHSWIGKGLFLNPTGKDWYFYHGGHSLGHKSIAIFHKSKGYGVVIMTNSENGSALIWSILRAMSLSQSWDKFIN